MRPARLFVIIEQRSNASAPPRHSRLNGSGLTYIQAIRPSLEGGGGDLFTIIFCEGHYNSGACLLTKRLERSCFVWYHAVEGKIHIIQPSFPFCWRGLIGARPSAHGGLSELGKCVRLVDLGLSKADQLFLDKP